MFPLPLFIHTHTHTQQVVCLFGSRVRRSTSLRSSTHTRVYYGLLHGFFGDSVESQISPSTSTGAGTGLSRSGRPFFVVTGTQQVFYFILRDCAGFESLFLS